MSSAFVVGILALSAVDAAGVTGSSASGAGDRQVVAVAPPAPNPPSPTPLPPVTEHALDPSLLEATRAAPATRTSVTQTIQLAVLPGPLELLTPHAAVELHRQGPEGHWIGPLPPVRLIDARGTHEGWSVRWTVDAIEVLGGPSGRLPGAQVEVVPDAPVVVAGTPDGLRAGEGGRARPTGRTLFSADPGSGGGTYEASGTVSVRLPRSVDAGGVVVRLALSVT